MKRRHDTKCTTSFSDPNEWILLGYAYGLDVFISHPENTSALPSREHRIAAVICAVDECHSDRKLNWTMIIIGDGCLTSVDQDVTITLPHLVEIHHLIARYTEHIT